MYCSPAKAIRAAAIIIPVLLASAPPASAQVSFSIGYNSFHDQLSRYGTWSNDPRWGRVWHPTRVSRNFRPYYDGHWVNTREYGWLWVSNERFGDITYHYGRWILDPRRGWLWVPGYVWAPSWVVWRSGGGNIAWFPMPPGDNYYGNGAYSGDFNNHYGYDNWYGSSFDNNRFLSLWIVVGQDHFADQNYRNYVTPQRNYGTFIAQSRDVTNYSTPNNYVVNRSIDAVLPQRGARFQPVAASSVIGRNAPVTPVNVGRQIEQRDRPLNPVPASANPSGQPGQGRGNAGPPANAAPPNAPASRTAPANPAAPPAVTAQQNANPAPQDQRGGRNDRNPGANPPQGNPQARPVAPAAPATPPAIAPNSNPVPQDQRGGRNDRNPGANAPQGNPQARPVAPAAPPAIAAPQSSNPAPQDARGRRNDRSPAVPAPGNPQADRTAPAAQPAPSAAPDRPAANGNAQTNRQSDRGTPSPQTRSSPPQAQANAPVPANTDNAPGNQPSAKRGGPKNADNQKPVDGGKKTEAGRGQN